MTTHGEMGVSVPLQVGSQPLQLQGDPDRMLCQDCGVGHCLRGQTMRWDSRLGWVLKNRVFHEGTDELTGCP